VIGILQNVKALIRKYSILRSVDTIPAEDWNHAVETYAQNRPLIMGGRLPGQWLHPWEISGHWDHKRDAWRYSINPGFVNGVSPVITMAAADAPEEFAKAADVTPEARLDVPLGESPQPIIKAATWRALGEDAAPTGAVSDTESLASRVTFEDVPEFFQAIGVGRPPVLSVSSTGGFSEELDGPGSPGRDLRRLLRACEVILRQPRAALRADVTIGSPDAGSFAQIDFITQTPLDRTPRISASKTFTPAEDVDPSGILSGQFLDEPEDTLHLATLYVVSPRGAEPGSVPDETWQFHASHHVFWSLNHDTNNIPPITTQPPLTFPFPLALGVGTSAINAGLAVVNDNADLALEAIRAGSLRGKFWTI
jgi:hypothetical protein